MNKIIPFLKILLLLGMTTVGGCAAGYALGSEEEDPVDIPWEQISAPPEMPVKIIESGGLGRNAENLIVESASGKQYEWSGSWVTPWKEAASRRTRTQEACPDWQDGPLERVPGEVIDCAFLMQWEWATEEHYVVLLEDGSLWRWRYYEGMAELIRFMTWGALAGFLVGFAILIFTSVRQDS